MTTDLERIGRHVGNQRFLEPKAEVPCYECRTKLWLDHLHPQCHEARIRISQAWFRRREREGQIAGWNLVVNTAAS